MSVMAGNKHSSYLWITIYLEILLLLNATDVQIHESNQSYCL